MGAKQREWARKLRRKIMRELGSECVGYKKSCGSTNFLELDCKEPVRNNHGRWSYDTRIRFYREQLAAGNLQILCNKCHDRKSGDESKKNHNHPELHFDDDNTPF